MAHLDAFRRLSAYLVQRGAGMVFPLVFGIFLVSKQPKEMCRIALSDVNCRNARPGLKLVKLSNGGGLQLWVQPTGSRLWRLAYRFDGKQKLLALGSYPLISLAEAREARDDAKRLLLAGIDPGQGRSLRKAGSVKDSFRSIADEYVNKLKKEGRADRTIAKVKWLLDFAYPPNRSGAENGTSAFGMFFAKGRPLHPALYPRALRQSGPCFQGGGLPRNLIGRAGETASYGRTAGEQPKD